MEGHFNPNHENPFACVIAVYFVLDFLFRDKLLNDTLGKTQVAAHKTNQAY